MSEEKYRNLLKEISKHEYTNLEQFIDNELTEISDEWEEYSDSFLCDMLTICRLLIDEKAYGYVENIVSLNSDFATYENSHNDEECVFSYAIRKIDDESVITQMFEGMSSKGEFAVYFFSYELPSQIAIEKKMYGILKLLSDKNLFNDKITNYDGYTPLQFAVMEQDLEFARFLLEDLKHDPNIFKNGVMPLAYAVKSDDFKMVQLLIEHGADTSVVDDNGNSLISYCSSEDMREKLQIHYGVKCEDHGQKLLFHIINDIKNNGCAQPDAVKELLKYELPQLSVRDNNVILCAARYGDINTLKELLPYKDVKDDYIIREIFSGYITNCDLLIELTNVLIDAGIVIENAGNSIFSPYYRFIELENAIACYDNDKLFVLFDNIEKLGYGLENKDAFDNTIFHYALTNINTTLIKYCLSKGMSYRALETENISAIEVLLRVPSNSLIDCKKKNIHLIEELLQILIQNGCDINHQDKHMNTPLHKLVRWPGVTEYQIELAMKYNANPSLKNDNGETPYDIGLKYEVPKNILEMLTVRKEGM